MKRGRAPFRRLYRSQLHNMTAMQTTTFYMNVKIILARIHATPLLKKHCVKLSLSLELIAMNG
jgi:hypothetical protein